MLPQVILEHPFTANEQRPFSLKLSPHLSCLTYFQGTRTCCQGGWREAWIVLAHGQVCLGDCCPMRDHCWFLLQIYSTISARHSRDAGGLGYSCAQHTAWSGMAARRLPATRGPNQCHSLQGQKGCEGQTVTSKWARKERDIRTGAGLRSTKWGSSSLPGLGISNLPPRELRLSRELFLLHCMWLLLQSGPAVSRGLMLELRGF